MIKIGKTLVSDDLKDTFFVCNLSACHGDCCVEGDAGAPLEEEEISIIEDHIDEIKPYMTNEGREVIELVGVFDYDTDSSYVTPLVNNRDCAFAYKKDSIYFCSIERAFIEGKIKFQKPISCHLYPIRLKQIGEFTGVNYDKWSICKPAVVFGKKKGVLLYQFLKEPLIRKFGEEWYKLLEEELRNEE